MTPNSTLSGSARRALRAAAHHLNPVVTIGQAGLTPAVLHEIDVALTAHALIKVRVSSDDRAVREAHLERVCELLRCEPVQHLGKLLVLWRNREGDDAEGATAFDGTPRQPSRGPRKALPQAGPANRSAPGSRRREPGSGYPSRKPYANEPARREGWAPRGRDASNHVFGSSTARGRFESRRRDDATDGSASRRPRGTASGFSTRDSAKASERSRWGERRPREDMPPEGGPKSRRRTAPAAGGQRDGFTGKPRGFAPRGAPRASGRNTGNTASPRTAPTAPPKARTRRRTV